MNATLTLQFFLFLLVGALLIGASLQLGADYDIIHQIRETLGSEA